MFGLSAEFDDLVLNGKEKIWIKVKEEWFCKTPDCKIPGKLKIGEKNLVNLDKIFFKKKKRRLALMWDSPQKHIYLEITGLSKG